jgi:hypothetical protein
VRYLATSAGLDPERFLPRVRGEDMAYTPVIGRVAELLRLSKRQRRRLAGAYVFERLEPEEVPTRRKSSASTLIKPPGARSTGPGSLF